MAARFLRQRICWSVGRLVVRMTESGADSADTACQSISERCDMKYSRFDTYAYVAIK